MISPYGAESSGSGFWALAGSAGFCGSGYGTSSGSTLSMMDLAQVTSPPFRSVRTIAFPLSRCPFTDNVRPLVNTTISAEAGTAARRVRAAAAVARFLRAEKLVFLSDVPGIFRDRKDPATLLSHLKSDDCRALIADGTIDAGMIPKVEASLDALSAGVKKVHIIDAGVPHSLLLEVYSNTGIGTEIVR